MDDDHQKPASAGPQQKHMAYVRRHGYKTCTALKSGRNANNKRTADGDRNDERTAYRLRYDGQCRRASVNNGNDQRYSNRTTRPKRSGSVPASVAGPYFSNRQPETSAEAAPHATVAKRFNRLSEIRPAAYVGSNPPSEANGRVPTLLRAGRPMKVSDDKRPTNQCKLKPRPHSLAYVPRNKRNLDENPSSSSDHEYNEKSVSLAPKLPAYYINTVRKLISNRSPNDKHKTAKTSLKDNAVHVSEPTGDLNKLHEMTAIEFDRDRYARYGVHESEIKDEVRTMSFKTCIELCAKNYIKDKVVLVIRCGIGFLPLLCVRFGFAKQVIGLEQSACIEYARRIVKDNLYSNQITLIQSSVQDLKELPHGLSQVDVIVSDCLGECVLGQGDQMEQVILARNRFLKPTGILIPKEISLYGHLSEQRRAYENTRIRKKEKKLDQLTNYDSDSSTDSNYCSWWRDVYGFDLTSKPEFLIDGNSENEESNQKWRVMAEPIASHFNSCRVVSSPGLIKTFDLLKCSIEDLRYVKSKNITLHCITPYTSSNGGEYGHMLEMFMVVDFPTGEKDSNRKSNVSVGFSTSSGSPLTRYKQIGLLLRDQLLIIEGDKFIINEFIMQRGPQNIKPIYDPSTTVSEFTSRKSEYEDSLKLRLNYTFVNKYTKAIDRRCIYTITKYLF